MTFLDKAGLERLWAHIILKLNGIKIWTESNFITHNKQTLSESQKQAYLP